MKDPIERADALAAIALGDTVNQLQAKIRAIPRAPAEALAVPEVLKYYAETFCEGFCNDLPQAGTYTPKMDLDCSGCKARAALAALRALDAKGGDA